VLGVKISSVRPLTGQLWRTEMEFGSLHCCEELVGAEVKGGLSGRLLGLLCVIVRGLMAKGQAGG